MRNVAWFPISTSSVFLTPARTIFVLSVHQSICQHFVNLSSGTRDPVPTVVEFAHWKFQMSRWCLSCCHL